LLNSKFFGEERFYKLTETITTKGSGKLSSGDEA